MSDTTGAFAQAPNGKKMLTLVAVYICVIAAIMQSTGLSIVLPIAAAEFDALAGITDGSGEAMQLYSLASSLGGPLSLIIMPLWGYIAARSPHIKSKLAGASVIVGGLAVLLRALATNIWIVIASGILWGVVSAGVYVLGYVLIRDMFPGPKAGVYLGIAGTMLSFAAMISPVVTGFLAAISWRAVCHVIWPLLVLGGVLMLFGVNITKQQGKELASTSGNVDFLGIIATALFLLPLILGISMGRSYIPFGSPLSFAAFAVALVALIVLIFVIRKKGPAAVIPSTALKNRNTLCLAIPNFLLNFANMFTFFFLPAYIMYVMGPTELGLDAAGWSGIIMGSFALLGIFLGPIFGRMIGKSGSARLVVMIGIVARLVMLLFCIFFLNAETNIFVLIAFSMVFGGVYSVIMGVGFAAGANIMVPDKLRQQSTAVVTMGQNLGSTPATAIGGILIAIFGVAQGMPIGFMIAAIATAAAIIPALMLKKDPAVASESK